MPAHRGDVFGLGVLVPDQLQLGEDAPVPLRFEDEAAVDAVLGRQPLRIAGCDDLCRGVFPEQECRPCDSSRYAFERSGRDVDDQAGDFPAPAGLQVLGHEADVPVSLVVMSM